MKKAGQAFIDGLSPQAVIPAERASIRRLLMRFSTRHIVFVAALLAFSGCITSHYKNDKGCECTRRYFTIFGIPTHSCSDACQTVVASDKIQGQELKIAAMAPSPSLRQSTPAKTIEQNIKTTTQALR